MEPILYITITQFVFAALLVFTKKHRQAADLVLGSWLLVMTLFLGLIFLKENFPDSIWGRLQMYPLGGLLGPFLYIYTRALTDGNRHPDARLLWHLLPFGLLVLGELVFRVEVDAYFTSGTFLDRGRWTFTLALVVLNLVYLTVTFRTLKQHQLRVWDLFSFSSEDISLHWLLVVVMIFGLTFLITLFILLAILLWGAFVNPGIPIFIGFGIFAYAISYYGVRQGVIYDTSDISGKIVNQDLRYATSSLSAREANRHIEKLKNYMHEERPYLNRELTVQAVAKDLEIAPHHLTETLNEYLGKNFYTFVNEYRVEEVKKLLQNPAFQHYTLLAIAFEAGFNSKSAFNATFKKITGMTPSAYRQHLEDRDN